MTVRGCLENVLDVRGSNLTPTMTAQSRHTGPISRGIKAAGAEHGQVIHLLHSHLTQPLPTFLTCIHHGRLPGELLRYAYVRLTIDALFSKATRSSTVPSAVGPGSFFNIRTRIRRDPSRR